MSDKNLLIVLGATAVGKTKLAVQLADTFKGEIISADSRQIFKGMDIGTGKDLSEYYIGGYQIPYHLIDHKNAGDKYHVNAFKDDFFEVFTQIVGRQKLPILCGGTGMYIHSLLQNQQYTEVPINQLLRNALINLDKNELLDRLNKYKNQYLEKIDHNSIKRLIRAIEITDYLDNNDFKSKDRAALRPLVIGLYNDVETRRKKILNRLAERLENGLVDEVRNLLAQGVSQEILTFYGLEYKFVVAYINGALTYTELQERLGVAICQFAKRQMTFFRKMAKDGVEITWIETDKDFDAIKNEAIDLVRHHFQ
jgi:tRNA dimethylallyltransferase